MASSGVAHWIPLLARFLGGQATVHAVNLATGIMIVWFLGIEQYAIYTLASVIQGIGTIGADLGVVQGVTSIGAPLRGRREFDSLLRAATRLRNLFFALTIPVMILVALATFRGTAQPIGPAFTVVALTILNVWILQSASLATAVLNIDHDARGLLVAGLASALLRLALVLAVCQEYPLAVVAVGINLAGSSLQAYILSRRMGKPQVRSPPLEDRCRQDLLRFAMPLVPGAIYYMSQSQLSTFVLGLAGATTAIAEVGALGRLAQIVGLLTLLNGFFVIPYFGRIQDSPIFVRRATQLLGLSLLAAFLLVMTAVYAPAPWLWILGPQYAGLHDEVVLAVAGGALLLVGNVAIAMIMGARATRGQWIGIAVGIVAQIAFAFTYGLSGTHDALVFNLIPLAVSCSFQCIVLIMVILARRQRPHATA